MGKVKYHDVNPRERYEIIGDFFDVVSGLGSKKETFDFFFGLLTPGEILMLARRIQIAQMLLEGLSYEDIRGKIGASNQTITKTDRWLHGENLKYNKWLEKCLKNINKTKKNDGKDFKSLLDKYPGHRLLKDIIS